MDNKDNSKDNSKENEQRLKEMVKTTREKLTKYTTELNEKLTSERKLKGEITDLLLEVNKLQGLLLSVVKFSDD